MRKRIKRKFLINKSQKSLPEYVRSDIIRYNLRYYVSLVDGTDISEETLYSFFDSYDKENRNSLFFKFEAVQFPNITQYSLNG